MGSSRDEGYFVGAIIEESLEDPSVLDEVEILRTSVEPVTPQHQTTWAEQLTLHEVQVPGDRADAIAQRLSDAIDREHPHAWYADFRDEKIHFVVFRDKVFRVDRSVQEDYVRAVSYGRSLGIPERQLDFAPITGK